MALTISSTLRHLVDDVRLEVVGQDLLDPDEDPVCTIYGTRTFMNWRDGTLPYYRSVKGSEVSPDEEVDLFFREFMLGRTAGIVTRLTPTSKQLWEVRLTQSRLFGWFESPGHLVLHLGDDIDTIKQGGRPAYAAAMDDVANERSRSSMRSHGGDIVNVRSYND